MKYKQICCSLLNFTSQTNSATVSIMLLNDPFLQWEVQKVFGNTNLHFVLGVILLQDLVEYDNPQLAFLYSLRIAMILSKDIGMVSYCLFHVLQ